MGEFATTMGDLGDGIGSLLTAIVPSVLMLVIGLGVGGAIVAVIGRATKSAKFS